MRDRIITAAIGFLFALLCLSLFYTQIIRYPYYSRLSKNNAIRIIPIAGPRGNILDRNGMVLVSNRLSFDVAIVYQELRNRAKLAGLLQNVLGMSKEEILRSLEKASEKPYAPVTIVEDIDKSKALELEESSFDISGIFIETKPKRDYIYKAEGSHVFGYLSEIGKEELESLKDYGYRMKDLVGRSGVEKHYDTYLKGVDGGTQVEIDNRGRQMRILGFKEPSQGKDLYLTIDLALQAASDKLLGSHKGAIVVMNPQNGEVLALASHPSFDPNIFIKPKSSDERLKLLNDRIGRPLSNRAISGLYSPGSVFKVVTASGALETRRISTETRFFCSGIYVLGRGRFACWKEQGHGSQNVKEGITNSCNVFFYNTGRALGVDSLEAYAKLFGFGKPAGIDLPDEVSGLVPGRLWKRLHRKDSWYEGETINYAIGQGYLLVTPIQVLDMMAVMANRGSLIRPHVVKRIGDTYVAGAKLKHIGLRDETVRKVREGLFEVVNNENGTGKRAKIEGIAVAGKTGTAENPQGRTHAWFAGFAPYNDPKICLVVFLEHGGKGGLEPAEIAKNIFDEARRKGYL